MPALFPAAYLSDVDEAAWRAGWDLKVFGYVGLTRHYLAMMQERRRGVIVNVIGLGGERLDASYIAGAMGNAGLMAFTRAIGGKSTQSNVRVVGVNPGPVLTDRVEVLGRKRAAAQLGDENRWRESFAKMPYGRPASTDEIAATVVFLASDLSSYTSGTIVTIDGGIAQQRRNAVGRPLWPPLVVTGSMKKRAPTRAPLRINCVRRRRAPRGSAGPAQNHRRCRWRAGRPSACGRG